MVRWLMAVLVILLVVGPAWAQGFTVRMSGDVIVPTGTVHDGSVMTINGRIQVDGTLQGDALTMNGDVTVSGTVTGSVRTFNGSILVASTARVAGDAWTANGRVDLQPGAVVAGRIVEGWVFGPRRRQGPAPGMPRPWAGMPWAWRVFFRVLAGWMMVGFIVLAAAVAALFPQPIQRVSSVLGDAPGQALLAGVLLWVLLPPLAVALAVSIIGIPALAFIPLGLTVLGLVGFAAAAMLLGNRITEGFRSHSGSLQDTVVGAAILAVLAFVPGLGWLAVFVAITWGIGGVLLLVLQHGRPLSAPAPPPSTS